MIDLFWTLVIGGLVLTLYWAMADLMFYGGKRPRPLKVIAEKSWTSTALWIVLQAAIFYGVTVCLQDSLWYLAPIIGLAAAYYVRPAFDLVGRRWPAIGRRVGSSRDQRSHQIDAPLRVGSRGREITHHPGGRRIGEDVG